MNQAPRWRFLPCRWIFKHVPAWLCLRGSNVGCNAKKKESYNEIIWSRSPVRLDQSLCVKNDWKCSETQSFRFDSFFSPSLFVYTPRRAIRAVKTCQAYEGRRLNYCQSSCKICSYRKILDASSFLVLKRRKSIIWRTFPVTNRACPAKSPDLALYDVHRR